MTSLTLVTQSFAQRLRAVDRVWLALAGLFLVLTLLDPRQAWISVGFTLDAFLWITPFLLLSVVLAAWLKAAGADRLIGRLVAQRVGTAILLAALAGSLSPFCSCGVVPLVAALLAAGVPLPAVFAFWVASPLMDPETFVLMAATLGLEFTLAKTLAAFGLGLLGGFATLGLQRLGLFGEPLKVATGPSCGGGLTSGGPVVWAVWREAPRRQAFHSEALAVGLFLAKWLLLAFAIESLMVAWLPPDLVAETLGGSGWQAIPMAAAVGVPAYLNGFAAIPLIGELMAMGMAPGAALTFLIAGGVTSLPAAMAVFALVRRPVFLWYLAFALIGAVLAGALYQMV
ncbi:MAG: permease [Pseudomonadota bacterium]